MLPQFDPKATHGFCGSAFQSIQHERPAHVGSIMHDPQLPFDFRICDKQTSLKRNAAIICSRGHKRGIGIVLLRPQLLTVNTTIHQWHLNIIHEPLLRFAFALQMSE